MIRSPVAPVMSATTRWSCRFISVSAFLHVLDVRGRVLEQTLALAQVGAQFNDLPFGRKLARSNP
jgi:hypothetical protein